MKTLTRYLAFEGEPGAIRSGKAIWIGRVIAGLLVAYLLFGGVASVMRAPFAVEGTVQFGYPESAVVGIGLALLVSTVLYAVPRTAVLGAILLTGYLGGATATHVRMADGYFLLPVAFCVGLWLALYLRDPHLHDLLPLRRRRADERRKPAAGETS